MALTYVETASWATIGTLNSGFGWYKDITFAGAASGDLIVVFGGSEGNNFVGGTRAATTQSGSTGSWTLVSPASTFANDTDAIGAWATVSSTGSVTVRVQLRAGSSDHIGACGILIPAAEWTGTPAGTTFVADADGQVSVTLANTSTVFYAAADWSGSSNPGTSNTPAGSTNRTSVFDSEHYSVAVRTWTAQGSGTRAYGPTGLSGDDWTGVVIAVQEAGGGSPASGAGSVTVTGAGTARGATSGAGSATITGAATARAATSAAGSLTVTGSATARGAGSGPGALSVTGAGAATGAGTGAGALTVTGAATARGAVTGSGSITITGSGVATAAASGAGSVALTGSGTGTGAGSATGNGSLTISGAGTARAAATGAAALTVTGAGTAGGSGAASGAGALTITGSGTARGAASGVLVVTVTGSGTATETPTGTPPLVRTLTITSAARSLTVATSARDLSIASPPRSLTVTAPTRALTITTPTRTLSIVEDS